MDNTTILQALRTYFDESELQDLCFSLEVDYEALAGKSKAGKTRELIRYMDRRGRRQELVSQILQLRPHLIT